MDVPEVPALSHSLHQNPMGVSSQRFEIIHVRREDRSARLREGHHESIDSRSLARSPAKLCGSSGKRLRELTGDIARPEEPVGPGIPARVSLKTLDQDHRRNGRRPESFVSKSENQGGRASRTLSQVAHGSGVEHQHGFTRPSAFAAA